MKKDVEKDVILWIKNNTDKVLKLPKDIHLTTITYPKND